MSAAKILLIACLAALNDRCDADTDLDLPCFIGPELSIQVSASVDSYYWLTTDSNKACQVAFEEMDSKWIQFEVVILACPSYPEDCADCSFTIDSQKMCPDSDSSIIIRENKALVTMSSSSSGVMFMIKTVSFAIPYSSEDSTTAEVTTTSVVEVPSSSSEDSTTVEATTTSLVDVPSRSSEDSTTAEATTTLVLSSTEESTTIESITPLLSSTNSESPNPTSTNLEVSNTALSSTDQAAGSTTTPECEDQMNCTLYISYCNVAAYSTMMMQKCSKSCGFCAATTTTTGGSDCVDTMNCAAYTSYCNVQAYREMMMQKCKKSCSFCGTTTVRSSGTDDITDCDDTMNCTAYASYCSVQAYRQMMQQKCKKSCFFCETTATVPTTTIATTAGCADSMICAAYTSYCAVAAYKDLMNQKCKKTCSFCETTTGAAATTGGSTTTACADTMNCAAYRTFCGVSAYNAMMSVKCAKTCGFC